MGLFSHHVGTLGIIILAGNVCGVKLQRGQFALPACEASGSSSNSNGCYLARFISLSQQDGYPELMRVSRTVAGGESKKNQSEYHLNNIPSLQVNSNLVTSIITAVNDLDMATSTALSQFNSNSESSINNASKLVAGVESSFANSLNFLNQTAQTWLAEMYKNDINSVNTVIKIANTLNGDSSGNPVYGKVAGQLSNAPNSLKGDASYIADLAGNMSDLTGAVANRQNLVQTSFQKTLLDIENKMSDFMAQTSSQLQNSTAGNVYAMTANVGNGFDSARTNIHTTINTEWTKWNQSFSDLLNTVSAQLSQLGEEMTTANTTVYNTTTNSNTQLALEASAPEQTMVSAYNALNNATYHLSNLVKGSYSPYVNTWGINAESNISNLTSLLANASTLIQQALANGSNNSLAATLLASMSSVGTIQNNITNAQAQRIQQNAGLISNLTNRLRNSGLTFQSLLGNLSVMQEVMSSQFESNSTSGSSSSTNSLRGFLSTLESGLQNISDGVNAAVTSANVNLSAAQANVASVISDFKAAVTSNASNVASLLSQISGNTSDSSRTAYKQIFDLITNSEKEKSSSSGSSNQAKKQNTKTQSLLFGADQNVKATASQTNTLVLNKAQAFMPSLTDAQTSLPKSLSNIVNQISIEAAPSSSLFNDVAQFRSRYNATATAGIASLQQSLESVLPLAQAWKNQASNLYNIQAPLVSKNSSSVAKFASASGSAVADTVSKIQVFQTTPLELDKTSDSVKKTLKDPLLDPGPVSTSASKLSGRILTQNSTLGVITSDLSVLNQSLRAELHAIESSSTNSVHSILQLVNTANNIDSLLNQETNILYADIDASATSANSRISNDSSSLTNVSLARVQQTGYTANLGPFTSFETSKEAFLVSNYNGSLAPAPGYPPLALVNASLQSAIQNGTNKTSSLITALNADAVIATTTSLAAISAINASVLNTSRQLTSLNLTDSDISTLKSLLQNVSNTLDGVLPNATAAIVNLTKSAASNLTSGSGSRASDLTSGITAALEAAKGIIGDETRLTSGVNDILSAGIRERDNSASVANKEIAKASNQIQSLLKNAVKSAVSSNSGVSSDRRVSADLMRTLLADLKLWNSFVGKQIPFVKSAISDTDSNLEVQVQSLPTSLETFQNIYLTGVSSLHGIMSDIEQVQFDLDDRISSANYSLASAQEPFGTPVNSSNVSTSGILGLLVSKSALTAEQSDQTSKMAVIQTEVDNMLRGAR